MRSPAPPLPGGHSASNFVRAGLASHADRPQAFIWRGFRPVLGHLLHNTPGKEKSHLWVDPFPLHRKGWCFRRRELMLQMGRPELHHLPALRQLPAMVVGASHFPSDVRQLELDVI